MIVSRHEHNKRSNRESQLFARLVSVLRGSDVTLGLSNGTCVTGTIESYGKDIKTANLFSSLAELSIVEPLYDDFDKIISENSALGSAYKAFNPPDTSLRISAVPKSSLLLKDAIVEYNSKKIQLSLTSVRESHIATLSPRPCNPDEEGTSSRDRHGHRTNRHCNIKESILQEHRDYIKNQAFIKCNHIGSNNTRN